MSWPSLSRIRFGCVKYLNARPLIHAYDGPITFGEPAWLADELAADRLDLALIPAFEMLRHPEYQIVDDVSISSRGPVYSVVLAFRGELADIRQVALDPASRTSNNLLRIVLEEFHGMNVEFRDDAEARLVIGDPAIRLRADAASDWRFLDLGEEWTRHTGLPFVFAVWAGRAGLPGFDDAARELRELKDQGCRAIPGICAAQTDPRFCHQYLGGHIRYDFGPEERAGLERFFQLASARISS